MGKKIVAMIAAVVISFAAIGGVKAYTERSVAASESYRQAYEQMEADSNQYHIINTYRAINTDIMAQPEASGNGSELLYYQKLNEREKTFYRQIHYSVHHYDYLVVDIGDAIANLEDSAAQETYIKKLNASVQNAQLAYYFDHPAVYWANISDTCITVVDGYLLLDFKYYFSKQDSGYTEKELQAFLKEKAAFDTKLNSLLKKMKEKTKAMKSDWKKALYISRWLCQHLSYDEKVTKKKDDLNAATLGGGIYAAVMRHTCVCRGYAQLYQYLLNEVGIPCQQCTGKVKQTAEPSLSRSEDGSLKLDLSDFDFSELLGENDINHVWNVAKIDGACCNIDVTYMDQSYEGIPYDATFFGVNDKALKATHEKKGAYTGAACDNNQNSFFVHEKLYYKSVERASIDAAISYAIKHQQKYACVQYQKPSDAEKAYDKFVTDSLVVQDTLMKYNKTHDDIITLDEKRTYRTMVDSAGGVFYIFL